MLANMFAASINSCAWRRFYPGPAPTRDSGSMVVISQRRFYPGPAPTDFGCPECDKEVLRRFYPGPAPTRRRCGPATDHRSDQWRRFYPGPAPTPALARGFCPTLPIGRRHAFLAPPGRVVPRTRLVESSPSRSACRYRTPTTANHPTPRGSSLLRGS